MVCLTGAQRVSRPRRPSTRILEPPPPPYVVSTTVGGLVTITDLQTERNTDQSTYSPTFNETLTVTYSYLAPEPSTAVGTVFGSVAFIAYGWSRHRRAQRGRARQGNPIRPSERWTGLQRTLGQSLSQRRSRSWPTAASTREAPMWTWSTPCSSSRGTRSTHRSIVGRADQPPTPQPAPMVNPARIQVAGCSLTFRSDRRTNATTVQPLSIPRA